MISLIAPRSSRSPHQIVSLGILFDLLEANLWHEPRFEPVITGLHVYEESEVGEH